MMRWVAAIATVLAFALVTPSPALAAPPPYYPPIDYVPASRANYDVGRTAAITTIVIHETDGTWLSATNWFQNRNSRVSAHYLVRARYGIPHTYAQYRSSALLVCAIARRYGIPTDRAHIVGHNELRGTDHSDPGPTWNWNYYMSLVNACSWQRAQPVARAALRTVPNQAYVPSPGLEFDNASDEVLLLQWDLAFLGFIDSEEVAGGGSRFGPLTAEAVTRFQQDSGIYATGTYGAITRMALAARLHPPVAREPADGEVELMRVGSVALSILP